ncbi:MAG: sulfite exporter TauE/SafE family protein [Chroococcidiopsidaceae cyanobacterium CP_BM_RX_35]|nr:sulfite exporter TauE/SafE family protein [Chroococcidiopsidaceae cyanobacterium CP_BM_RX_35]
MTLGFLGSFGHCAGMCGPLTVAFSLAHGRQAPLTWRQQLYFHGLLNLGRVLSYVLFGAGIGALSSVLVASGQLAGIGSGVRQGIAILTGILLIWFGLAQIAPDFIPRLPLLRYLGWHNRISAAMTKLSLNPRWWTPALIGMAWGLVPCGFLYAAQIKAASSGNLWTGGATMLAFGLGTMPVMLGVGVSASLASADRRSQLFRMGGWVTLIIGVLTLLRTGDMVDYTGHAALFCLMLALLARPLSCFWPQPLRYRRGLGVGAFVLSLAHTGHMLDHALDWNLNALSFMLPVYQVGMWAGILAVALMTPAALTSFDRMVKLLGKHWRHIHLLSVPALVLCAIHIVLTGSHYLGDLEWTWANQLRVMLLVVSTLGVLLVRSRFIWSLLSLERFYASSFNDKK